MKNVKDFVRIPGNARRFRNTKTGEEISRWAMQSLQAGGINPRERAKIRSTAAVSSPTRAKQKKFNKIVTAFKSKTAVKLGIKPSAVRVRGNTEQAKDFRAAVKKLNKLSDRKLLDKSPDGELAQILVELNLRDSEWDMPVGESPS